jgi:glyoxylase-like metal-dependent hydrolase (beta-lactamase superfamily II)
LHKRNNMISNNGVKYFQVAQGVWGMKIYFVNVYIIINRRGFQRGWTLVDTGPAGSANKIIAMAEAIFGPGTKPLAIVLTHGHPDHAGSAEELLKHWDVPVYVHRLELPYVSGIAAYPPPDFTVGGGLMSLASIFFPKDPVNIGNKLRIIDMQEGVPELPEWKVIHTPGHTPGHVSMFLPLNTTLIAGDAFVTTKSESAICVFAGVKRLSGPPMNITTDWEQATISVRKLADLQPRIAATGHGPVMRGRELQTALQYLADNFENIAIPKGGRYADDPAVAGESGPVYIPPFRSTTKFKVGVVLAGTFVSFLLARAILNRRDGE